MSPDRKPHRPRVGSRGARPTPGVFELGHSPHIGPGEHGEPPAKRTVAIVPDDDGRDGWTVVVDGVPSSHLDLDDATRLDFEYMRWMCDVLDLVPEPGAPLRVAHLGGAGCTLPRYVEATRPGSTQVVFEIDEGVLEAVKKAFGVRSSRRFRLRVGDGREGLGKLAPASQDVVIRDAFAGALVPPHLRTREFLAQVQRVLAPGGVYLANLADSPPLAQARSEAATTLTTFRYVSLIAEPAQLKGRRYGNVVLAGSAVPLPEGLGRRLASGAVRARLMTAPEVRAFAASARALEDG